MNNPKIRTLVVDDSVFYRGVLKDALENIDMVDYSGSASNGTLALAKIEESLPDLVTLDVEMPGMNGVDVLEKIKEQFPEVQVVMISSATRQSAKITIKALEHGALDFILKPTEGTREENERQLHRELKRVLNVVQTKLILRGGGVNTSLSHPLPKFTDKIPASLPNIECEEPIEIVAIGVSTGGPVALQAVLGKLPESFDLPILIIQHMPPLFITVLVETLNSKSRLPVVEIQSNQPLSNGVVHIAPGGYHTKLIKRPGSGVPITVLTKDPPENFCRPSVDYTFRSLAEHYRGRVLAVIMTGMGKDGVTGLKALKRYGAKTIAQDEASSVVFGMAMEAVNAQVIDQIVPLSKIADAIVESV